MAWRCCVTSILILGTLGRVTAVASDIPTTGNGSEFFTALVTNSSSSNEENTTILVDTVTKNIVASRRIADGGGSAGRLGGGFRNPNQDLGNVRGQMNTEGIECYSCSNCATVNHLTPKKRCPSSQNPTKANKCVQFSQIYNALNETWWVRGCPQERGSCKDIQANLNHPSIVRVETCVECVGDLCNSGPLGAPLAISMATLLILTCLGRYIVSW